MMTMERSRAVSAQDLRSDGPPVRVSDLARWTGFTSEKILQDIYRGDLRAMRSERRTAPYLIDRREAMRYLSALGF